MCVPSISQHIDAPGGRRKQLVERPAFRPWPNVARIEEPPAFGFEKQGSTRRSAVVIQERGDTEGPRSNACGPQVAGPAAADAKRAEERGLLRIRDASSPMYTGTDAPTFGSRHVVIRVRMADDDAQQARSWPSASPATPGKRNVLTVYGRYSASHIQHEAHSAGRTSMQVPRPRSPSMDPRLHAFDLSLGLL